jgi:geranylgeranyl reductase family protein
MASGFYDVIIAGAGPAGLHAAQCCEGLGLSVLVLEEHKQIGRPGHCSGLISANLELFFPKEDMDECIEHRVRGAIMHSPGGSQLRLEKPGTAAYVIDRPAFDRFLASRLSGTGPSAGPEIRLKSAIDAFTVLDDSVLVKSGNQTFESSALLGCDGSNSFVRRQLQQKPKETMNGLIAVTEGDQDDRESEFVEMWFDKELTDGFLWKIPRKTRLEYGMLGTAAKFDQLKKFFGLSKAKGRLERYGGIVPLGPPKTYSDRVLLVGDAACQVKPWSGGGVIYSLTAAEIAAKTINQAKSANDFSESFLKRYEHGSWGWKKAFGGRIRTGMLARSMFKRMNNTQLNLAMRGMGRARFLMNKLDMDFLVKK